jgi:hypothetical protein
MEKIQENQDHIDRFICLAKLNTEGAWEEIDDQLKQYCNDSKVLNWAKENTANTDSGLSDLAATILEATSQKLDTKDIDNLVLLMRSDNEENQYPSFRAACALAKREISSLLEASTLLEVENKLKEFIEDDSVSDIVEKYINVLQNTNDSS